MIINTNLPANRIARQVAEGGTLLTKALARLSSGSKIVSPEDDAAGLSQSSKLNSQIRRLEAITQTNNNLISFLQTQDGYLAKITQGLNRMSELSILSKDVTKTAADVGNYLQEFDAIQSFFDELYNQKFNGVNLFSDRVLQPVTDGNGGRTDVAGTNLASAIGTGNGEFTIRLKFTGGLTEDQRNLFYSAANRWQSVITADLEDAASVDDVEITVNATAIDGAGGVLASAGPNTIRGGDPSLPITGSMNFDTADLSVMERDGRLFAVILHEMGHVLGIGTLWDAEGLIETGDGPEYNGANAVAQYNKIFGTSFSTLPLEDDGGAGTAEAHPEEDNDRTIGGDPAPGLGNELMTGFAEAAGTPMPLSTISIGFLADLGYEVDYTEADPYFGPGTGGGPRMGPSILSTEKLQKTIEAVAQLRAQVGANLSDARNIHDMVQIERENLSQAVSRITDVNVAEETTQLAKAQILVNSGTAMLSQANLLPELALRLLG